MIIHHYPKLKHLFYFVLIALLSGCQPKSNKASAQVQETEAPTELNFQSINLDDLSGFQPVKSNWSIAGRAYADHTQQRHLTAQEGTGVLVNLPDSVLNDNIFTSWEHGDLELKLEVMMPAGSNSGIYLQGRYEVQLLDSWGKDTLSFADIGGIYQRWDPSRPKGEEGYEGHPPALNAAKAPGLWQQFHIIFRAPRFDQNGHKIENARFEKVVHNGVLVQEMVEVTGPTRAAAFEDEVATGPLMIQGDHGPVALRNISYKRYFDEPGLTLKNIQYQYFEIDGPLTQLPLFDSLQAVREGTTDSLVYKTLSDRDERVAYIFRGQLEVEKSGEYLFTVYSDDGSQLFIEGDMLIDNDGKHDYEPKSGLITLAEGLHEFRLDYFNNNWGQGLTVMYEGPEMKKQSLLSRVPQQDTDPPPPITIQPQDAPEMVRSFVMHQGEKLTHAISVGHPDGLHYSVDLRRGSLLQFWRGDFADVTDMWYQRGHAQLLQPMEMAVASQAGLLAAVLPGTDAPYPTTYGAELTYKAYELNQAGLPAFQYQVGESLVTDQYLVDADSRELLRTIKVENPVEDLYTRVASAEYIQEVGNGYYAVGGEYYLRLETTVAPIIRDQPHGAEMLFPLTQNSQEITYAILW